MILFYLYYFNNKGDLKFLFKQVHEAESRY